MHFDLHYVQVFHPEPIVSLLHCMLHNSAAKKATPIASSDNSPLSVTAAPVYGIALVVEP